MIEDPPLITLRRGFPRPPEDLVSNLREALREGLMTGHVVDALGGRGALDYRISPVAGPGDSGSGGASSMDSFCGVALTCHAGPADNLAVFGAVAAARPGDIIVAATDGFTGTAVTGDLLLGMARNAGVAGFVTDGLVRDLPGITALGMPCYAAGASPNSPARNGPGTVGLPVDIGGARVEAGDIVIGDGDGVVVVPRDAFETILGRIEAVRAAEAALEEEVKAGLTVPPFIETLFETGRVREI